MTVPSPGSGPAAVRRRPRRRGRPTDDGQATVELALVLPVVALLLMVLGQVMIVAHDQLLVAHAAREAARAAAVAEGDPTAAAREAARGAGDLDPRDLETTVERRGEKVRVTVRYRGTEALPLLGPIVDGLELRAAVTMQSEP